MQDVYLLMMIICSIFIGYCAGRCHRDLMYKRKKLRKPKGMHYGLKDKKGGK